MRSFLIKMVNFFCIVGILMFYNASIARKEDAFAAKKAAYMDEMKRSQKESSPYEDGVFRGEGDGYGGKIILDVTLEKGVIEKVDVVSAKKEDAAYFTTAAVLLNQIVEEQSTNLDTISGATFSSGGILDAAEAALSKARKDAGSGDEAEGGIDGA